MPLGIAHGGIGRLSLRGEQAGDGGGEQLATVGAYVGAYAEMETRRRRQQS